MALAAGEGEFTRCGLRSVVGLEGVAVLPDGRQGQPCPRTLARLASDARLSRSELLAALRGGDPSIVLGPYEDDPEAFYVHPLGLTDAEADAVVAAVGRVLEARG